jgi:serine/threonine-protein kinase
MAMATPQVLESLRKPNPTSADTFFLEALSEARRANVAVTASARYFRLKN